MGKGWTFNYVDQEQYFEGGFAIPGQKLAISYRFSTQNLLRELRLDEDVIVTEQRSKLGLMMIGQQYIASNSFVHKISWVKLAIQCQTLYWILATCMFQYL